MLRRKIATSIVVVGRAEVGGGNHNCVGEAPLTVIDASQLVT